MMVAIIDYDAGNLKSVQKAFQKLGVPTVITRDFQTILHADTGSPSGCRFVWDGDGTAEKIRTG